MKAQFILDLRIQQKIETDHQHKCTRDLLRMSIPDPPILFKISWIQEQWKTENN